MYEITKKRRLKFSSKLEEKTDFVENSEIGPDSETLTSNTRELGIEFQSQSIRGPVAEPPVGDLGSEAPTKMGGIGGWGPPNTIFFDKMPMKNVFILQF